MPMAFRGFPDGSEVKNQPAQVGDADSIPGLGRSPGKGNGNPLPYSCLENPMHRGAWRVTVKGVAESQTWSLEETVKFRMTCQICWNWIVFRC